MANWFTSDIHYNHSKIIQYANRQFSSVGEMNEHIRNSWKIIRDGDDLWSLGDFAFCKIDKIIEWLESVNSKRFNLHLINGNHDKEIKNNKRILLDSGLVKSIRDSHEFYCNNEYITLYHYGQRVWNKSHHGSWQLFGHSHGSLPPQGKSVDVGLDSPWILNGKIEYRPFHFNEIKKFMDAQPIYSEDYHGDE